MTSRFVLALLVLLLGCAPRYPLQDPGTVSRVWSILHPRGAASDRLTARFSLQVETKERTGRLVGQLWGYSSSVIRLDLASGTGASVAMIRETPDLWTAYIPSENKAYHHPQARAGLDLFQIPVPFNAKQMSSLLSGNLGPLLGPAYSSVSGTRDGGVRFDFSDGAVSWIEAPADLSRLTVRGREGWILTCEKPYSLPAFPEHQLFERYTFESPREGRAVLRVKSLEPGGSWRTSDLDLNLPPDVQWMRILHQPLYN